MDEQHLSFFLNDLYQALKTKSVHKVFARDNLVTSIELESRVRLSKLQREEIVGTLGHPTENIPL